MVKTAAQCEAEGKFFKAGKCSRTRPPTAAECAAQGKKLSAAGNCVKADSKPRSSRRRDVIQGITRAAIARLVHTGGIATMSGLVYEETRGMLAKFLRDVLGKTLLYTGHARRSRVSSQDVLQALELLGMRALAAGPEAKPLPACKPVKGDLATRVARYHAKFGTCTHIPKAAFGQLVREIAGEADPPAGKLGTARKSWTFAADAMGQLHRAAESFLVRAYSKAADSLVALGRKKLLPGDVPRRKD